MNDQPSAFDPRYHLENLESKIIASMERLSQVFRVLLWKYAKEESLSPIQIQILIHLMFQPESYKSISVIARTFNMTKATISDAVKLLELKNLIGKEIYPSDARRHTLVLTDKGKKLALKVAQFANPLLAPIEDMSLHQKEILYQSLLELIDKLNRAGIIQPVKMCFSCQYYKNDSGHHYCQLLEKQLTTFQLQIDCPEHSH